jgi:hypothetical protein
MLAQQYDHMCCYTKALVTVLQVHFDAQQHTLLTVLFNKKTALCFDVSLILYYIVLQVLQVLSATLPDVQLTVKIAVKSTPKQLANALLQRSAKHHSVAPTVLHTLAVIAQQSTTTTRSSTAQSDSSCTTVQQQRCIGKHFAAVVCAVPAAAVTGTNCRITANPLMNRYDAGHVTGHVIVPLCTASGGSSLGVLEASSFTTAQYEVLLSSYAHSIISQYAPE